MSAFSAAFSLIIGFASYAVARVICRELGTVVWLFMQLVDEFEDNLLTEALVIMIMTIFELDQLVQDGFIICNFYHLELPPRLPCPLPART
jgi:hypothetical protein